MTDTNKCNLMKVRIPRNMECVIPLVMPALRRTLDYTSEEMS